ncbi:MAG: Hpt domain-containing protein, partial [Nitrospirota bacterium]
MGSESLSSVIAEAEEIIDGLNQNLLAMEASDKSNIKPDLLNSVFRAAHTLKGISGMAGLKNVSELSH